MQQHVQRMNLGRGGLKALPPSENIEHAQSLKLEVDNQNVTHNNTSGKDRYESDYDDSNTTVSERNIKPEARSQRYSLPVLGQLVASMHHDPESSNRRLQATAAGSLQAPYDDRSDSVHADGEDNGSASGDSQVDSNGETGEEDLARNDWLVFDDMVASLDAQDRGRSKSVERVLGQSSYPPTTSGRPSEVNDQDRYLEEYSAEEAKTARAHFVPVGGDSAFVLNVAQDRERYRQKHIQDSNQAFQQGELRRQQEAQQSNTAKRKTQFVHESLAAPHSQPAAYTWSNAPRSPPMYVPAPNIMPGFHNAQQTHSMVTQVALVQTGNYRTNGNAVAQAQLPNINKATLPRVQHANTTATPAPQFPETGHPETTAERDPTSIDYSLDALHAMSFEDLCQESFDTNHQKTVFITPVVEGSNLSDKLALVVKANREEQTRFLASLEATEWERAGTWFTEQFTLLMQRMQQSRQERRKIANTFEEEITKRHHDLSKEANNLDGALKNMRRSGDAVLRQSTPKRTQGAALNR